MRYLKRFISANESDLQHRYRGYSQIFDERQLQRARDSRAQRR